jgi:hypothetical protein
VEAVEPLTLVVATAPGRAAARTTAAGRVGQVFTSGDPGVHDRRFRRSRAVIPLFTPADFGVHVPPISAFTSGRSPRSRSPGACRPSTYGRR